MEEETKKMITGIVKWAPFSISGGWVDSWLERETTERPQKEAVLVEYNSRKIM